MSEDVIYDREAERALLAAILGRDGAATEAVRSCAADGLRSHHFHSPLYADVFAAMLSIADHAGGVDPVTVIAEMERLGRFAEDPTEVHALAGSREGSGDRDAYARRVRELADWRAAKASALEILAAIEDRDHATMMRAAAELEAGSRERRRDTFSPAALGDVLYDFLSSGEGTPEWVIPLPFRQINDALAGGLWPGEVMLVGGHTSTGKSVLGDMMLDYASDKGFRCHCYMTEMTALLRGLRYLTRRTGVPFPRLRQRTLDERERRKVLDELTRGVSWGLSIVSDWSIEEVVSDALRARYQLVFVDLLHGFHYRDERELDHFSKEAQRLARVSTTIDGFAGMSVVAGVHLQHGAPDRPTHDHIKGGGSPKQDADFTLFVRLLKTEGGVMPDGEVYITKGRGGDKASVPVTLNGRRFRFEPRLEDEQVVSTGRSQEAF